MVNTLPSPQNLITDTWVRATWEEFLAVCDRLDLPSDDRPALEKARCYYDAGWMRIEAVGIGSAHGQDNSLLAAVVTLYGTLRNIPQIAFTNGSFRKVGERECQPDLAYYIGAGVQRPPKNNQPVDVNAYGAPTLAIEIASTTLNDDLGQKRLLYERLGVQEYWVVDVQNAIVIAFAVAEGGSRQIQVSQVLPGLAMKTVEEALQQSQTADDTEVNRWLMQQFQALG
ncbi:MAG: Uma2 family endonuclease [Tildeniella nuda ZEHNDER 1965/U140]|jgi:Uma2 family endonuclease|nr:Uma2 family endonuclease [Tildeniella nuda ZEHNDER 1965/U140]